MTTIGGRLPVTSATRPSRRTTAMIAMFGVLLVAYALNAMDRQVFPVLLSDVRDEFGFGDSGAGLQSTAFALGLGLAGVPSGYLAARMSRKHLVLLGTAVFSAATLLTTSAAGFWDMVVWRVLSGVGESFQVTALFAIAAAAFARRVGTAIGMINVAFGVGSFVGPAVGGRLLSAFGSWRVPMVAYGLLGVAIALVVALAVRPWFSEARAEETGRSARVGGAERLLNHNTVVLGVVTALGGLVDFGFIGLYPSFLRDHLSYTPGRAGITVGAAGVAALFSGLGGYLGDRYRADIVLPVLFAGSAGAALALFLGPSAFGWQLVWSFAFGLTFSAGVFVNLAGYLVKSVRPRLSGAAAGIFVTTIYIPAGFAGYLFSWLVSRIGWTAAGVLQLGVLAAVCGAVSFALLRPRSFSRPEAVNPPV